MLFASLLELAFVHSLLEKKLNRMLAVTWIVLDGASYCAESL